MYAILQNNYEILRILLEHIDQTHDVDTLFNLISKGGTNNNNRIINLALHRKKIKFVKLILRYVKKYIKRHAEFEFHDIDQYHNTYLHILLAMLAKTKQYKKWMNILRFFAKYTDVNYNNYWNVCPREMLEKNGRWEDVSDIALQKQNKHAKNLEMNLVLNITLHDRGVFNPNFLYSMVYMSYLMKKYDTLYVPTIKYKKSKHKQKIFQMKMSLFDISISHKIMNKLLVLTTMLFYSFLPHYIVWINKDCNYVDPNLGKLLMKHDQNDDKMNNRFVVLKLTIINQTASHANMIIYDRLKKIGRRFEPYGTTDNGKDLDDMIRNLLEECYGKIVYLEPKDYLSEVTFQMTSGDDNNKNLIDPFGYCLAWSIWFVDIRLQNPDIPDDELVKNAISFSGNGTSNYYLDFIRNYGAMLDMEKNKFLLKMGVNYSEYYSMYPSNNVLRDFLHHFKR